MGYAGSQSGCGETKSVHGQVPFVLDVASVAAVRTAVCFFNGAPHVT